jgi:Type I phosphodiesterase / nucleotide pyrophosphatase
VRIGTFCLLVVLLFAACTSEEGPPSDESSTREPGPAETENCDSLRPLIQRVRRGWYQGRSPELGFVVREPNVMGLAPNPPHDGAWDFLAEVPLVMYGPGVIAARGIVDKPASMVDLAPTAAALVDFDSWPSRSGLARVEALEPGAPPPRLVVTIVWDGVGDNVLRAHPNAWPFLKRIMGRGTAYSEMTIGSTPSNTAPIHASLGTGAFPRAHGVVSVSQEDSSGRAVDPWADEDPSTLELATLGDLYDRSRDNAPEIGVVATVNWHLGMIGHGAALPRADHDLAALLSSSGSTFGNAGFYDIPSDIDDSGLQENSSTLDSADGRRDGHWGDHPLDNPAILATSPAYAAWQQEALEQVIAGRGFGADEVPDLLYTNFKQPDSSGHRWGMSSPEVGETVRAVDRALERLVSFLNRSVGRGRWALMLTADHGQTPSPRDTGGFQIQGSMVREVLNEEFDRTSDGVDLVARGRASGVSTNAGQPKANDVTLDEMAEWLAALTMDEALGEGADPPPYVSVPRDAPLFDAVVIKGKRAIKNC